MYTKAAHPLGSITKRKRATEVARVSVSEPRTAALLCKAKGIFKSEQAATLRINAQETELAKLDAFNQSEHPTRLSPKSSKYVAECPQDYQ